MINSHLILPALGCLAFFSLVVGFFRAGQYGGEFFHHWLAAFLVYLGYAVILFLLWLLFDGKWANRMIDKIGNKALRMVAAGAVLFLAIGIPIISVNFIGALLGVSWEMRLVMLRSP